MKICPECGTLAPGDYNSCPKCDSKMNNLGKVSKKNLSTLVLSYLSKNQDFFESEDFSFGN